MRPERIVLVGGRRDGEEFPERILAPGHQSEIYVPEPVACSWVQAQDFTMIDEALLVLVYGLDRDPLGWPSRDDAGRLRYVYRGIRQM